AAIGQAQLQRGSAKPQFARNPGTGAVPAAQLLDNRCARAGNDVRAIQFRQTFIGDPVIESGEIRARACQQLIDDRGIEFDHAFRTPECRQGSECFQVGLRPPGRAGAHQADPARCQRLAQ
ncbi:hypothetical protein OY671_010977, partial [Metschnikowia pulcherrima]